MTVDTEVPFLTSSNTEVFIYLNTEALCSKDRKLFDHFHTAKKKNVDRVLITLVRCETFLEKNNRQKITLFHPVFEAYYVSLPYPQVLNDGLLAFGFFSPLSASW